MPATPEQIEIRRAQGPEREAVLAMWIRLVEHHRRLDPHYPVPSGLRLGLRSEIDRGLQRAGCAIWVAQSGGAAVGFVFAELETGAGHADAAATGWIHELWVEPDFRGRGLAAALVERASAFIAEHSGRIAVRVEAANGRALGFWRARGFRERAHVLERECAVTQAPARDKVPPP